MEKKRVESKKRKGKPGKQAQKRPKFEDNKAIAACAARYASLPSISSSIHVFADLPLSPQTQRGLEKARYTQPTDVQREVICRALGGDDILGAAKTGQGKTLAFIVPLLECLWRSKWSSSDGLGAIVISPTRELAYQTFTHLRNVGQCHEFSAALLIGGTDVEYERSRVAQTNILICTPGRLLQHMDETPQFDTDNVQMVVLDEADRILDMGFRTQLDAIMENMHAAKRQTMLMSATQTKSVTALARVSMKNPVFISVHEHDDTVTPENLTQTYMVCKHEEKVNMLYSFLLSHQRCKTLVFVSSCKQARFLHESFRKLRCGMQVMALFGDLAQARRVNVYDEFSSTDHCALFATDVAARGLDFPSIDWVVQYDCPSDVDDYVHRVGRTARFNKSGHGLLLLAPEQQESFVKQLEARNVPIDMVEIDEEHVKNGSAKLMSTLVRNPEMKEFAQRALIAYIKGVNTMHDKTVFDVHAIDVDAMARSLGLAVTPRVRFLRKQERQKKKPKENGDVAATTDPSSSGQFKMEPSDDEEDLLTVKRTFTFKERRQQKSKEKAEAKEEGEEDGLTVGVAMSSKRSRGALAKSLAKRQLLINQRQTFSDSEGGEEEEENDPDDEPKPKPVDNFGGLDLAAARKRMARHDVADKLSYREKMRAVRREKKVRAKAEETEKKEARKQAKLRKKLGRSADDLDEVEEDEEGNEDEYVAYLGGEGEEGDVDLDWLPDPDSKGGEGKHRADDLQSAEALARGLLQM